MSAYKNKRILLFISTPLPPFKGGRSLYVGASPLHQAPIKFHENFKKIEFLERLL